MNRFFALIFAVMLLTGCLEHRVVSEEMTWEPLPDGSVRLRFLKNPSFFEVVHNPALLARLQASGSKTVTVDFDAGGRGMLYSYRVVRIAGEEYRQRGSVHDVSGYDGVGSERHPLEIFSK